MAKEKVPKERPPNMLALRVPCDARISWRGVKLAIAQAAHPETPAHPVLLGKFEGTGQANTWVKILDNIAGVPYGAKG